MSKIKSIIEAECFDEKPSDVEWTLRKEDVALIAKNIKEMLIQEIEDYAEHLDDALNYIKEYL